MMKNKLFKLIGQRETLSTTKVLNNNVKTKEYYTLIRHV